MRTERFVFEDWSDGEFGDKPPEQASFKAFSGSNVIRYRQGLLGPRPGLAQVPVANNVAGRVWGFYAPTVIGARLVMVIGDQVFRANSDFEIDLVEFASGSPLFNAATTVVPFTVVDAGTRIYFSVPGDNLYEMNCLADQITEVVYPGPTSFGPVTVKAHRDRLYTGGDSSGAVDNFTLLYSDAADFTTFDALNFINVGYNAAIYLLEPLGNNLIIGTRLSWYALVGGSPSGTLREIYTAAPSGKQNTAVNHEGLIWYWSYTFVGGPENGGENGPGRLAFTNGTIFDTDEYRHLILDGLKFGLVAPKSDAIIFTNDLSEALLRINDAWARLAFEVETTGPVANVTEATRFVLVGSDRGTSEVYEITSTATGGTWNLTTDQGEIFDIPFDVTVDQLADLVYFGIVGGCEVTAGTAGVDWVLTFTGSNQGRDLNVSIDDTNATGGTVTGAIDTAGAASEADYYQLRLDLERPGFVGDVLANPGDNSDTPIEAEFATKLVRHPEALEIRVRKVFVDFQKWQTGVETNGFDCVVRTYDRNGSDGYQTETKQWAQAGAATAVDGESDRHQMNYGERGFGGGFQVKIENMVGVAVRRIIVDVDINDGRQQGA